MMSTSELQTLPSLFEIARGGDVAGVDEERLRERWGAWCARRSLHSVRAGVAAYLHKKAGLDGVNEAPVRCWDHEVGDRPERHSSCA